MTLLDSIRIVLYLRTFHRSSLKNGIRYRLNDEYDFRRFCKLKHPGKIQEVSKLLSTVSRNTVGSILPYPIMKGENYDNKDIMIIYPKGSDMPCAINALIVWEHEDQSCLHLGLVLVDPQHQKKSIQYQMVLINGLLTVLELKEPIWLTDLGRSASGSRWIYKLLEDVCPYPVNENGENCVLKPFHLSLAKSFYDQHRQDAGISPLSELVGFTVKNSNSEGGADALINVNKTTRSRNTTFNNFIAKNCPNPTDEVIMVGRLPYPLFRLLLPSSKL